MFYRRLGATDLEVSALCLGTMTFGEQDTEAEGHSQLDLALDTGINFIDTAEMYPVPPKANTYGESERIIGTWLKKRGGRDRIVVASKASGPAKHSPHIRAGESIHTKENLAAALHGSLRRLQTDYIDLYQLHWPDRPTNFFGQLGYKPAQREDEPRIVETLQALADFCAAGKIRHVGLSNETPWGLMTFLAKAAELGLPRIASIQNPYNLLNRSFEVGLAEIAHREKVGLLAYSPLAMGMLTGKYADGARPAEARITRFDRFTRYSGEPGRSAMEQYVQLARETGLEPAQMAISFILTRPYVTSVILGATTIAQLQTNLNSLDVALSKQTLKALDKIQTAIPNPCP